MNDSSKQPRKHIYLVRHCEFANPDHILAGRLPLPLSKKGKAQAQRLRKYFQDKQIEHIYSSAVLRCKQTAEAIAQQKIPITYDQRLLEIFSAYQGYAFYEKEIDARYLFKFREELGGENFRDMQQRMMSFWQGLVKTKEKNVIVCSHGDPLYTLHCGILNTPMLDECVPAPADYQPVGAFVRLISYYSPSKVQVFPFIEV